MNQRIPPYIRFDSEVFLWLTEQKPQKQKEKLHKMREIFDGKLKGYLIEIDESNHEGRMLRRFEKTMNQGFSAYNAHYGSLYPNGEPNEEPNEEITENKTEKEKEKKNNKTDRQQTKGTGLTDSDIEYLYGEGFSREEIEWVKGLNYAAVKIPRHYAAQSIKNRREENVSQADFSQRPPEEYETKETPEQMLERLKNEMGGGY